MARLHPIESVARELALPKEALVPVGRGMVKLPVVAARELVRRRRPGKLVLVSALTPTPHGEGKTVVAISLAMALSRLGHRATVCLRQPSLGPVFGLKGGASGGGRATVEPREEIDLGRSGDMAAVAASHNLLSALIDNHLFHGNRLAIDPGRTPWPRTVDMEDRSLRAVVTGVGIDRPGFPRPGSFDIAAASEVMAIHSLARDPTDLTRRLGSIVAAFDRRGAPLRARDLGAAGAMAVLLGLALGPTLVQTSEGTPAFVHGGPFGNIAHGTCSRISIELARATSDYAVVEAGFATELGAEKFVDLVAPGAGLPVDAVVIVATVRALRYHGGAAAEAIGRPNATFVTRGLSNLGKHIENIRAMGAEPLIALNRFRGDASEEVAAIGRFADESGVAWAVTRGYEEGGSGTTELARGVVEEAARHRRCRPLYRRTDGLREKVETVVTRLYGGKDVAYSREAELGIEEVRALGGERMPICIAKTPLSLSDDAALRGRPEGFTSHVSRVRLAAGAGFAVVEMGSVSVMPGLPSHPRAERMSLSRTGEIRGL